MSIRQVIVFSQELASFCLVAFKMRKGGEDALIVWYLSYQRSALVPDLPHMPRG
jgi:hypothetical protein